MAVGRKLIFIKSCHIILCTDFEIFLQTSRKKQPLFGDTHLQIKMTKEDGYEKKNSVYVPCPLYGGMLNAT